jgi:plastocyanin
VATLSFPKVGSYTLVCLVHGPMMKVTIVVKPKPAKVASPAQVSAKAKQQIAAAWASITKLTKTATPPANTVYAGVGDAATLMGFVPQKLTVKVGTTVTWENKAAMEIHNVVFGPSAYIDAFEKQYDLFPGGPGAPNQVSPALVYGTDPGRPAVYDGSNHGNGFFASPLIGSVPGLQHSTQITFTKAGSYHYFCLLHGEEMSGDIVVTP